MRWAAHVMLLLSASSAFADAIVRTQAMSASTIAEIYVEDEFIRLELEIGLNDLEAFRTLLPDEIHQRMGFGNEPFAARMQTFLDEQFVIVADNEPLHGIVVRIRPSERVRRDDITGEPLPTEGEPQTVVMAEFVWPLESRPKRIDLLYANNAAAVGFVIYHKGVAVNDFRYLTAAQRLHLDWNDPWYSALDTRNLRRQFYTPMAGFIYVEPYDVRKTYDGPLTLAKDMMIWNVTPDAVTAREIAYSEDSWPVEEPGPDSNMIATGKFTPLSDFLSEGSVFFPGTISPQDACERWPGVDVPGVECN